MIINISPTLFVIVISCRNYEKYFSYSGSKLIETQKRTLLTRNILQITEETPTTIRMQNDLSK